VREPGTGRGLTRSPSTTASLKTLEDYGLSYEQSSRFQKLADVPEDQLAIRERSVL
jgi:hypothetical protein